MSKRTSGDQGRGVRGFRSRPALIAVVAWWLAAILGVVGWLVMDAALADPSVGGRQAQVGIWMLGFAALAAVAAWGATIGALLRDVGRVRAGAGLLLGLPVAGIIFALIATRSTVIGPTDPLAALWLLVSFLLLGVGTLLIVLPAHLGTH